MYEVIIVGGGPAGLSAALMLGRCRRKVLVCDAGSPRNRASHGVHGYLTREGILPAELLALGRKELQPYGVEWCSGMVTSAERKDGGFSITLASGEHVQSLKLLLATGVVDQLPTIDGIAEFYGRSVFHCPYCDGWEVRDQPIAVYGRGLKGLGLALALETWSRDIVLCTDGPVRLQPADREKLARHGVGVRHERIARLEGAAGQLERIVFAVGEPLERRAMFFNTGQVQRSELARTLGCVFTEKGAVRTSRMQRSNIPGLYIAGDASHDVQFVVVAAAEGAKAAMAIHRAMQEEAQG